MSTCQTPDSEEFVTVYRLSDIDDMEGFDTGETPKPAQSKETDIPDEDDVYLAYNSLTVFNGSFLVNRAALKRKASKKRETPAMAKLLEMHDWDSIYAVVVQLYNEGVFTLGKPNVMLPNTATEAITHDKAEDASQQIPVYFLPLITQQPLVATLQRIMTHACYMYIQKQNPAALANQGWDCAAAADLGTLLGIIQGLSSFLNHHGVVNRIRALLLARRIVHASTTVAMDTKTLGEMVKGAEAFVAGLEIEGWRDVMRSFHAVIESGLSDFMAKKVAHGKKVQEQRSIILAERKELDKKEEEIMEELRVEELSLDRETSAILIKRTRAADDAVLERVLG